MEVAPTRDGPLLFGLVGRPRSDAGNGRDFPPRSLVDSDIPDRGKSRKSSHFQRCLLGGWLADVLSKCTLFFGVYIRFYIDVDCRIG